MNDACRVSCLKGSTDLDDNRYRFCRRQRAAGNAVFHRLTIQKLDGDEMQPLRFIDLIDRANVGMVQRGRSLRLALEAAQRLGIARQRFRQQFQGYQPAQF